MFEFFGEDPADDGCGCRHAVESAQLRLDARDCPNDGRLESSPTCRKTAVKALIGSDVQGLQVENRGVLRDYSETGFDVLRAAATFSRRAKKRDGRLADRATRDPVRAASEAAGRAGLIAELVRDTGLADFLDGNGQTRTLGGGGQVSADQVLDEGEETQPYEDLLRPRISPNLTAATIDPLPPDGGRLRSRRITETGATVRIYETSAEVPTYHIEPIEYALDTGAFATLEAAKQQLVDDESASSEYLDVHAAVTAVAGPDEPVDTLARILRKHTRGYGILDDIFADEPVSEVFVNASDRNDGLHVHADGRGMRTNVTLSERGRAQLASKIRTESGRPFSQAAPTIDALLTDVTGAPGVRVAGVCEPASAGLAFALRAEGTDTWRLSKLIRLGTISPVGAALLSLAMKRGGALLVAGPRGSGKTTMASALLWELPEATRLLAIEDTPELPIGALQRADRNAQRLRAATDSETELDPADALHTALRLGDGALVIGEVRGPEAAVLYEAMRVGAASDTVLGTIHGEGYEGVRERVVSDLGVPASSFATTDLLVTLAPVDGTRRVTTIEEVTEEGAATLFEFDGSDLERKPRLSRGNSEIVASLTRPGDTYADTLAALEKRADTFRQSGSVSGFGTVASSANADSSVLPETGDV